MSSSSTGNSTYDEWNIGTFDKDFLWSFYSSVNYVGAILCAVLMWSFYKSKNRTAGDILIGGLLSGCALMSVPCATQCFLNLVSRTNTFQYGRLACQLEAMFHVSSIMVQFFCVSLIGWRSYMAVILRKEVSVRTA